MERGEIQWQDLNTTIRFWQRHHGLDDDGLLGPQTLETIRVQGPMTRPKNRNELIQIFGHPGRDGKDLQWEKRSIVSCHARGDRDPLPGAPERRWVHLHRLVEPVIREGLSRAVAADPEYVMERIGGYVYRHQRHDTRRPLSYHSWGVAIDIDPHRNGAKTVSGEINPWDERWNQIWPDGLSQPFVEALESVGLVWGGRWRWFIDPMHFQFVN
jgi:hypothetical protein